MRDRRFILMMLVTLMLTGCVGGKSSRTTSLFNRSQEQSGPHGPDAVYIQYAVIERPLGNPMMDRQIWNSLDELVLPSEKREILNQNAIRVGLVSSLPSSELSALISNPGRKGSHREHRLYANNSYSILMQGPLPKVEYQVQNTMDGKPAVIKFENSRFTFAITPTITRENKIVVHCVPEVEYSDKSHWLPIGAVGERWRGRLPIERYTALGWDITLAPRDFLVIGTSYEAKKSLGHFMLTDESGDTMVQKLLVIKAGRMIDRDDRNLISRIEPSSDGIIPLATQAARSVARGQAP